MSINRNNSSRSGKDFFDFMGIQVSANQGENKGARGLDSQLEEAENVFNNLPLVESVLGRLGIGTRNPGYEDARNNGILALIHAIRKFDASKGFEFSTYAFPIVYRYVIRRLNYDAMIVVPPHAYKEHGNSKVIQAVYNEVGKNVLEEIPSTRSIRDVDFEDFMEVFLSKCTQQERDCVSDASNVELAYKWGCSKQNVGLVRDKIRERVYKMARELMGE